MSKMANFGDFAKTVLRQNVQNNRFFKGETQRGQNGQIMSPFIAKIFIQETLKYTLTYCKEICQLD